MIGKLRGSEFLIPPPLAGEGGARSAPGGGLAEPFTTPTPPRSFALASEASGQREQPLNFRAGPSLRSAARHRRPSPLQGEGEERGAR